MASLMKKLTFLISLTNDDNDYQQEQASVAQQAAQRYGIDITIICTQNDAITQSQQLLNVIQSSEPHPDAILFEPVGGTALPQAARAAAAAGIGWVVMNRDAEYIGELRKVYKVPLFSITSDHEEVGRIQGQQLGALLPQGGSVLYIQGPTESLAAKQRSAGMYEAKPAEISIKSMKAHWTEESSYKTVSSWLRLSTSQTAQIDVVAAQDDSMAMGARKAFQDHTSGAARERWLSLPYLGCDGVPKTGQAWVQSGLLAATIVIPAVSGKAIEMLANAFRAGTMPAERALTVPASFPALEHLTTMRQAKSQGSGL
ncbi:MAG: substrate-binding domain-containing protein [Acidobacteria bacterium]|nr:substrate-binding domain-containing protein [Acidobacteriota bacterium]